MLITEVPPGDFSRLETREIRLLSRPGLLKACRYHVIIRFRQLILLPRSGLDTPAPERLT